MLQKSTVLAVTFVSGALTEDPVKVRRIVKLLSTKGERSLSSSARTDKEASGLPSHTGLLYGGGHEIDCCRSGQVSCLQAILAERRGRQILSIQSRLASSSKFTTSSDPLDLVLQSLAIIVRSRGRTGYTFENMVVKESAVVEDDDGIAIGDDVTKVFMCRNFVLVGIAIPEHCFNFQAVRNTLLSQWKCEGEVLVNEKILNRFIISLRDAEIRMKMSEKGWWNIANSTIAVLDWNHVGSWELMETKFKLIWVQIYSLAMSKLLCDNAILLAKPSDDLVSIDGKDLSDDHDVMAGQETLSKVQGKMEAQLEAAQPPGEK